MWVAGIDRLGIGHAHLVEDADGAFCGFILVNFLVQDDGLGDLVPHGVGGVERGHRFLEDHGQLGAADVADFLAHGAQVSQFNFVYYQPLTRFFHLTIEGNIALEYFGRLGQQAHARQSSDALAAAAFPNQSHHFARRDIEGHPIEGLRDANVSVKVGVQVVDAQDGVFLCCGF